MFPAHDLSADWSAHLLLYVFCTLMLSGHHVLLLGQEKLTQECLPGSLAGWLVHDEHESAAQTEDETMDSRPSRITNSDPAAYSQIQRHR